MQFTTDSLKGRFVYIETHSHSEQFEFFLLTDAFRSDI